MDYAVGSVAALISGNVTPNRPRLIRKALTPTKHQASPNVTPKSEYVDDRSIFLSPSLQKKKAIVKKSPKRIFQNPDLDITNDGEGSSVLLSPKADKVKKHLKEELEADEKNIISPKSPKSEKKSKVKLEQPIESEVAEKNMSASEDTADIKNVNESTPKQKKKQKNSISTPVKDDKENAENSTLPMENTIIAKKRKSQTADETEIGNTDDKDITPKKKNKKKKSLSQDTEVIPVNQKTSQESTQNQQKQKKKRKKNKKGKNKATLENKETQETITATQTIDNETSNDPLTPKKKKKSKNIVNPNAITNKDTDSEHESDDDIKSETEQTNNQVLDTELPESSDEEEDVKKTDQPKEKKETGQGDTEDIIKRTLFVGNVPFSSKCKKEIKSIFKQYGVIQTVRIRTVPVKDARVTPKQAIAKNELHPERSTVNVYVQFEDASSVDKALKENNTVLNNYHLRVTRSDTTGEEHDPHKAIFVGNLPFAIEDDALRAKFEKCGEIESVRVVRDRTTHAGKGFGYVNFASKDGVELALAMSEEDLTIKNRILRVKRCTVTRKPGPQGNQRNNAPGNQRNNTQGRSQGMKQRNQGKNGSFGRNQDGGRFQGNKGQGFGRNQDRSQGQDGAHRRILQKRHNEESVESGPPNKRPNITQPVREKKPRKEFVGMTAEKKKKHKFNKGDKKKKALSEILTKYN